MKEKLWKDINNYPNYQISNYGRVKSKERYVNTVYGLITGGALLSEALATFGKAGVEALDSDYSSNKIWQGFNKYTGYMNRFERSLSDKGSESMLNFEQATNLVLDVASQLWQQRAIAKIPSYLKLDF